jgi:hypothetical protein
LKGRLQGVQDDLMAQSPAAQAAEGRVVSLGFCGFGGSQVARGAGCGQVGQGLQVGLDRRGGLV